jgi:hypothetical protein
LALKRDVVVVARDVMNVLCGEQDRIRVFHR